MLPGGLFDSQHRPPVVTHGKSLSGKGCSPTTVFKTVAYSALAWSPFRAGCLGPSFQAMVTTEHPPSGPRCPSGPLRYWSKRGLRSPAA
jgi:hypothetical protein